LIFIFYFGICSIAADSLDLGNVNWKFDFILSFYFVFLILFLILVFAALLLIPLILEILR